MTTRWFQVIYFDDDRIQKTLNAIIFLANPQEKHSAHITLRGPYQSKNDADNHTVNIRGENLSVFGVGNFFQFNQNTVFLSCGSDHLEKNWWKPHYDYHPHITIYDGESSSFAKKIYDSLNVARLFFSVVAGETKIIKSVSGQKMFDLRLDVSADRIAAAVGHEIDLSCFAELPEWKRLMWIERLIVQLKWEAESSFVDRKVAAI